MSKYLITTYRWDGGDPPQRVAHERYVDADSVEVLTYTQGIVASFFDEDEVLIAVHTDFESIALVTE